MSEPLLAVRGLIKRFANTSNGPLLAIDTFDVGAGACVVLTGDNGAGKSTLLRALAGLETAHAERFEFEGRPIGIHTYPPELRRRIQMELQRQGIAGANAKSDGAPDA